MTTQDTSLIGRVWRANTDSVQAADAYQAIFTDEVLPVLRGLTGFTGAVLLRDETESITRFMTVTFFDSMEAVRAFAGNHPDRAHVTGPARAVLTDIDETVAHYAIVAGEFTTRIA